MKISFAAFSLAALLLAGCGSPMAQMNSAVDDWKQMPAPAGNAAETASISQSSAAESTAVSLTKEQAEAIALAHAGFTADQVTRLRTEYEIDDGIPRFEVQFRQGRWEYDYEINADTGAILSYDRDD